jgi:hypothetical protein
VTNINKRYSGIHVNFPLFFSSFDLVWNFSKTVHKNLQHQILRKSFHPVTVAAIHANRWTDGETGERTHTMKLAGVFYDGANTLERVIPDTSYGGL